MPTISRLPASQDPVQAEAASGVSAPHFAIPAVGSIYNAMDTMLGERLAGTGSPGNRPEDVQLQLQKNARTFYSVGLRSPEQVKQWVDHAWHHDIGMAAAAGAGKNVGYEAVMTAGSESFFAQLPSNVLNNPAAMRAVVSLTLASADVITGEILGSAAQARVYNGRCGKDKLPDSVQLPAHQDVRDALQSAMFNMGKNGLRALVAPTMYALEQSPDGTVDAAISNRIDEQMDGVGGIVAGMGKEVARIGPSADYQARLMARTDLIDVLRKSRQSWGEASRDVVSTAAKSAVDLVKSPTTAAVIAYFAGSVGALLTANAAIQDAGRSTYQDRYGTSLPQGRVLVPTEVYKRLNSTGQMGALSFVAPLLAGGVQKGWETLLDKAASWLTNWSMRGRPPTDADAVELGAMPTAATTAQAQSSAAPAAGSQQPWAIMNPASLLSRANSWPSLPRGPMVEPAASEPQQPALFKMQCEVPARELGSSQSVRGTRWRP